MFRKRNEIAADVVTLMVALVIVAMGIVTAQSQQEQTIYFENFERGPAGTQIDKIRRYPDAPQIVGTDPTYPYAFPPPSGKYAARCNDAGNQFHGLGSVAGGPQIDLTQPGVTPIAIEAKLFLYPSAQYNYKNVALLALDDFGNVERYYRYGYGGGSFYFQYFDGSGFTEVLYDPILGEQAQVPGWHTFTMRFDSADTINFFVDGRATNFSPMRQQSITRLRIGTLIWDQESRAPLLVDDLRVYKPGAAYQPPGERASTTVEELPKISPMGAIQPGKPVEWLTDTNAAVELASSEGGKKFLVYFHRPGVGDCGVIEGNTLLNPAAAPAISRFVPVKIDASENRALTEKFEVYKVPQLLVFDMQSRIYWRRLGVLSVDELNEALARY